jgi:hypothetical protein
VDAVANLQCYPEAVAQRKDEVLAAITDIAEYLKTHQEPQLDAVGGVAFENVRSNRDGFSGPPSERAGPRSSGDRARAREAVPLPRNRNGASELMDQAR